MPRYSARKLTTPWATLARAKRSQWSSSKARLAVTRSLRGQVPTDSVPRAISGFIDRKIDLQAVTGFTGNIGTGWIEYDVFANIIQGTDIIHRVGREITVTGVYFSGTLQGGQLLTPSAFDDPYNHCRIACCTARKTIGAASLLLAVTGIDAPIDPLYVAGLLKCHYDKHMVLVSPTPSGAGYAPVAKLVRFYCPMNERVQFNGAGSNSNDKQCFLSVCSDSTVANYPHFSTCAATVYFRG